MTAWRDEAGAFWHFSLAFYARPGVAEALIALQDRDGREVNLILFALWLGLRRQRLDMAELTAAEGAVAPLRGMVEELRRMRRLKSGADPDLQAMRRRILAVELAGERKIQARLASLVPPVSAADGDRLTTATANLARYLGPAMASAEAASLCRAFAVFMDRR